MCHLHLNEMMKLPTLTLGVVENVAIARLDIDRSLPTDQLYVRQINRLYNLNES